MKLSYKLLKKSVYLLLGILIFLLNACGGSEKPCGQDLDLSKGKVSPVKIERLEQKIFRLESPANIKAFLEQNPMVKAYMLMGRSAPDSLLVAILTQMIQEPHIADTLFPKVQERYPDLEALETEFTEAFQRIQYFYPDFQPPKVYTVVTGLGYFFGTDLLVGQDAVFISLDFFMNPDAPYRPPVEQVPEYIWKRYRRDAIVPLTVKIISDRYNKTDLSDKTVLAEMIYWGKAYHFVKTMLPCTEDSLIIGYTSEDMLNLNNEENRKFIWGHFIEKDILYSNNQMVKSTYIEERPFTAEISRKAPGRIGQWLGWRIIQRFVEKNPQTSFQELMQNTKAQDIFQQSGYKGE